MNRWNCGISLIALLGYASSAAAQVNASATPANDQSELVIVTGTRESGVSVADSAAPIQVVGAQALGTVGQPTLMDALAQNAPSLQAQPGGSDLAGLDLQFRLRDLSPNDTLVLVDGVRRNTTAAVSVGIGPFQTGAAADLSFIPVDAIDHVEILQDGAAAQYGTDAIAGVVNIILKKNDSGGNLIVTGGQYYKGDGDTADVSLNLGLAPVEGAWLNITAESSYHDHTYRLGLLPAVTGTRAGVFPTTQLLSAYPNNVAPSSGDPLFRINNGVADFGYKVSDEITFYGSATYGNKRAYSYEGFRTANLAPSIYPDGFVPVENLTDNDYQGNFGFRGTILGGWRYDVDSTYGNDNESMRTQNTANQAVLLAQCAALFGSTCGVSTNGNTGAQSVSATGNFAVPGTSFYNTYASVLSNPLLTDGQTSFYDGRLDNSDWTNTIDLSREFDVGLASPLNVAFGGEARHETYVITPGEPSSYYGTGAQGFPGYTPENSGSHARDNYAEYLDLAVSPIEGLKVDVAGRHEHFSDFGDTTIGKLTARYDFNPQFAIRGTFNTGFRAPTLAEEFYSATSVSTSSATVVLPANSAAAKLLGINNLQPENTSELSAGIVAQPIRGLLVTVDAYHIDVGDRIVGSGTIYGVNSSGGAISPLALQAINMLGLQFNSLNQLGVSSFYNGVNTRTQGVDLTASYASDFGNYGTVEWNVSGTYNETTITSIYPNPAPLAGTLLLTPQATSSLADASPKFELIANPVWDIGDFSVNLRETVYGPSWVWAGLNSTTLFKQEITTKAVTNLELGYNLTHNLTLSVGAEDLFNSYPDRIPAALNAYYVAQNSSSAATPYPNKFAPFGIDGGYYYGKIAFKF